MTRQITFFAVIGWAALVAGSASTISRADDNREFQDQIIREINKQRTAYTEDMRTLREQNAALLDEIATLINWYTRA